MANPNKDKGTKAETAVVRWLDYNGYLSAERLALAGEGDKGDLRVCPGVMVQVKDGYTDGRAPTVSLILTWLAAVQVQADRGGFPFAALVHKRTGKSSPDFWRWYVSGRTLARFGLAPPNTFTYVQLTGIDFLRALDHAAPELHLQRGEMESLERRD